MTGILSIVILLTWMGFFIGPQAFCGESGTAGPGSRTLYLIRHGEYDQQDERDPDIGKALIPLGVAQARMIASRLRSLPVTMTVLRSSTMTRARQTALVIGEEFPDLVLERTTLLRECTPRTWRQDIMARTDPKDAIDCEKRLDQAFAEFFVPSPAGDRHEILVCHGNVIRYFVTKVLGVDSLSWLGMSIGNCSLTIVRVKPNGSMKLLSFGDIGHLPHNLQTGLDRKERTLTIPCE
jgi:serine/threonine-protein phosphatase PGAM5